MFDVLRKLFLVILFLPACLFSNLSTAEKFREMVDGVNEEARWSRLDLAIQRVHPEYRAEWRVARSDWGQDIQIADSEVTSLQIQDDDETAKSTVVVRWYRYDTMTLRTSTVEQSWERLGGHFALAEEEIVQGDEEIFFIPEEAEEAATSGGEAVSAAEEATSKR